MSEKKTKDKKKPITQITDKAIESVQKVSIKGYTDEQCEKIQEYHKELLKYARENNDNKEVAFVLNSDLTIRDRFLGSETDVENIDITYGSGLILLHNHPRNSSFSCSDVLEFLIADNIKTFTVVKNNGKVETLTKLSKLDSTKLVQEFMRLKNRTVKKGIEKEYRKVADNFLNKQQQGGLIEWIKS